MDKTGIIWTEKTWNPVSGCDKVSEGCKFCYAETIAEKYRGTAFTKGFDIHLKPHKLNEPYKWNQPTLCFVNSMSDLFHPEIPDTYRNQIIEVMEQNPQHEFQVLTKRPELMLKYSLKRTLPENFWAGVTIENKRNLYRLDILRKVVSGIKFASFEPLIGDLGSNYTLDGIDWVITGGESGNHLWQEKWQRLRGLVSYDRKNKKWKVKEESLYWVNMILGKSRQSGTYFFHKQWGGNYPEASGRMLNGRTYNEIPRYPGKNTEINNDYLKQLESKAV